MSLRILLSDELRGFYRSRVMLFLWVGLPVLAVVFYVWSPDTGGEIALSALVSLLVSSLSGRAVRHDVAMTGEVTLRLEPPPGAKTRVRGVKLHSLTGLVAEPITEWTFSNGPLVDLKAPPDRYRVEVGESQGSRRWVRTGEVTIPAAPILAILFFFLFTPVLP